MRDAPVGVARWPAARSGGSAIIGAGTLGHEPRGAASRAPASRSTSAAARASRRRRSAAHARERRYLPGVRLPDSIRVLRAAELNLEGHDLVCLAVPAQRAARRARRPRRPASRGGSGVLVVSKGLVPPLGTLPAAFASERCNAPRGGRARRPGRRRRDARARRLGRARVDRPRRSPASSPTRCGAARLDVTMTQRRDRRRARRDARRTSAVLAAAAASAAGPNIAGAAAGKVFAEVDALARARGGRPETFAGLAGAGDLVATVVSSSGSRNRRAGELLAQGVPAAGDRRGPRARPPRRSTRSRCSPRRARADASSRRRRSRAWRRSSRAGSNPSGGRRPSTEPATRRNARGLSAPREQR